jgi:hypothetical protein
MNLKMFETIKIVDPIELMLPASVDYKIMFKEALVDPAEEIKPQPIALSIGYTDYRGTNYPTPFGSYGDFSCIVGASKSKKTFFKSMLEASYIGGQANLFSPSIKGHDTKDKFVISFDTEQSTFHTQRVQRRVLEMVGASYDRYKTFSLRQYSPKERFDFIDWIVFESDFKDNIGLMSIDGYVDLVTDFNSLEQATGLTEKLLQWTAKGMMHCTGILHKNFGTAKPVGHVGSSVLKKAETVVFINTEEEITTAKCEYSRNIAFNNITFKIGNDWLPREDLPEINTKNWL